jgi:glycerophosphoryl diester phosphodiesterase
MRTVLVAVALAVVSVLGQPAPAPAATKPLPCAVIVHRAGDTQPRTENSRDRLYDSARKGYKCVEFDVVTSASGKMYVNHDNTLDRTSNCTGAVIRKTEAQLAKCRLDNSAYLGIPTVAHFLSYARTHSMTPVMHLKAMTSTSWTRLDTFITQQGTEARTVILTTTTLAPTAKRLLPRAYIIVTGSYPYLPVPVATALKYDAAAGDYASLTRADVDTMHAAGRPYLAFSPTGPVQWQVAADLGVDMLISNILTGYTEWKLSTTPAPEEAEVSVNDQREADGLAPLAPKD